MSKHLDQLPCQVDHRPGGEAALEEGEGGNSSEGKNEERTGMEGGE